MAADCALPRGHTRTVNHRPYRARLMLAAAAAALAACGHIAAALAAPPAQAANNPHDPPQTESPAIRKPASQTAHRRVVGATFGSNPQGLAVLGIDKNGVAARAGLRVGDLITEIDGRATAPIYWEYAAALLTTRGNTVRVKVLGRGELVLSFAPASPPSSPSSAK
jgi:membrane-associated protease RseP (regulator of RpoE activity)